MRLQSASATATPLRRRRDSANHLAAVVLTRASPSSLGRPDRDSAASVAAEAAPGRGGAGILHSRWQRVP